MGPILEILVITVMVLVLIGLLYFYFRKEVVLAEKKNKYTYDELRSEIVTMIDEYIGANVAAMGLPKQVVQNQEEQRRTVARSVRSCNSGNAGARVVVKDLIYNYLVNKGIDENNIDYAIPFNMPKQMSARQLFEIMMYMRDKDDEEGFYLLNKEYQFTTPKEDEEGMWRYEISEEDIRRMYDMEKCKPDLRDKRNILTQLLYSDTLGLGAIDTLNYQKKCVEEIQIGCAGQQQQVYNYKEEIRNEEGKAVFFSKDAVHVVIQGVCIWFSFLGFKSDDEMQRVLRNLVKDAAAGELTIENPKIQIDAVDGRRIVVSRPPMSDSWSGLIRKFDTVKVNSLDEMYNEKQGSLTVNKIAQALAHTGFNVAVTGEMSSGKTTAVRVLLKNSREDLPIRVIESEAFELDIRRYVPERNSLAFRITEHITEKDVLEFVRKTTGKIFCVGEVNSLEMANLVMNLCKISQQTFFSAHYVTTDDMVQDFVAAKICVGDFSDERLAEMDAVRCLQFDYHIRMVRGKRYFQYINEVVPEFDFESGFDTTEVTDDNASIKTAESIREVRKQLGKARTYSVRKILEFDEERQVYILHNKPSARCFEKARWYMTQKQYQLFKELFDNLEPGMVIEDVG